tara:strand:- start:2611 stop:3534 length:924 start_codon:yes stop_codon:yes gene_type:complete
MAFLDNSGDIILDAVLTDTGRMRMAQGNFRIAKFALGDDEINYELFDRDHPSGSAYSDLSILQSPIFEAFTNNTSVMKSRLVSIAKTDHLYLPVVRINEGGGNTSKHSTGAFIVAVDEETEKLIYAADSGVLKGENVTGGGFIRLDQGLDTTALSIDSTLASTLVENQYIIEIDDRFGVLTNKTGTDLSNSFIDDDQIASYFLTKGGGGTNSVVVDNTDTTTEGSATEAVGQRIRGPRGTILEFGIRASLNLNTSQFFFNKLGTSDDASTYKSGAAGTVKYIDSVIRVSGGNTGARVDLPVRFVKKQ